MDVSSKAAHISRINALLRLSFSPLPGLFRVTNRYPGRCILKSPLSLASSSRRSIERDMKCRDSGSGQASRKHSVLTADVYYIAGRGSTKRMRFMPRLTRNRVVAIPAIPAPATTASNVAGIIRVSGYCGSFRCRRSINRLACVTRALAIFHKATSRQPNGWCDRCTAI